MKTKTKIQLLFILAFVQLLSFQSLAQKTGNGNVTGNSYNVSEFTGINVGGAMKVTLIQAMEQSVYIETDENLFPEISVEVKNGILILSTKNIRKATKLSAIVTAPNLTKIDASGASDVRGENVINATTFSLKASGASSVVLEIEADNLETTLSGASKANLSGNATSHHAKLSGASKLSAGKLETSVTHFEGSGASDAFVFAKDKLTSNLSGASKVRYDNAPAEHNTNKSANATEKTTVTVSKGDTVNVNIGNLRIQVLDGDSTVVVVGNRKLVVDESGSVNLSRTKKHKFNGHWAGVDLGINGLLTTDFDMGYPAKYAYLDQRTEKSIAVNVNFYEQNIPLNKSKTLGLVSGLGLTWNNYRFANDVMLKNENNSIEGYFIEGANVRKSKLVNTWLTMPLYLELQTRSNKTKERAHIAAGVVAGWRFSSHTKIYFDDANKAYNLIEPVTGIVFETGQTPSNSRRNIIKDFNGFQQNPFKLDASVRAGWGIVNLYANYSLTQLFINDRGPELYPFAIGITLSSW
ncbi:MAG: head GIN domain-containing protein [Bacteroidales bacterium]|nr:head GIN domain-containing protein [Bacteroidales bacterium]